MSEYADPQEAAEWICARCSIPLEMAKVEVAYRGSKYPVNLPKCPRCGLVFVPEQLALGKMAEVEKLLEDK
ncbi:DVU_1557 family redox protein [Desulfomonile tiedjei]|uniref:DUF7479 domain-containing protein n=1 Tax=Desulfomonile tiedjei (strain ATCC 49306 / DSM 6799 / DCB-1) TaxID=706587 RepID=I4C4L4_DESTA|nr:CLJU_RS11820 family redox protein [Desulfomonile tiedjei]AFM24505.1 hypothetical protein Desti_1797 [Desulfomonile tiedjei DSM 6799]